MPVNAINAATSSIEISAQLREMRETIPSKNKAESTVLSSQLRGADAVVQGIQAASLQNNKSASELTQGLVRELIEPTGTRKLLLDPVKDNVDVRFNLNATASQRYRAYLSKGAGQ
ncbi:MAG: hypothetical protein L6Q71_00520 [Planctomycetes bacterium]|nr:hypothetical protein [Planctomycetota bacterium]NUQ33629.1 hypothetical protein [Planctomycetaceae bacterium]